MIGFLLMKLDIKLHTPCVDFYLQKSRATNIIILFLMKNQNIFDPHFVDKFDSIIIITKDDYSPYKFDEIIYDAMYLTEYLRQKVSKDRDQSEDDDQNIEYI